MTSGLPTLKVPMHVGGESYAWTRDGVRVATIVQPGNKFGAEPGVFVYERGDYLCSPDTPAIPEGALAFTGAPEIPAAALDGIELVVLSPGVPPGPHRVRRSARWWRQRDRR